VVSVLCLWVTNLWNFDIWGIVERARSSEETVFAFLRWSSRIFVIFQKVWFSLRQRTWSFGALLQMTDLIPRVVDFRFHSFNLVPLVVCWSLKGHGSDNSAENQFIKTNVAWSHVTHGAIAYLAPGIFSAFLLFAVIAGAARPLQQMLDILHVCMDDFLAKCSYSSVKDILVLFQVSKNNVLRRLRHLHDVRVYSRWAQPDLVQWARTWSGEPVSSLIS
jgi:hypothetical protein